MLPSEQNGTRPLLSTVLMAFSSFYPFPSLRPLSSVPHLQTRRSPRSSRPPSPCPQCFATRGRRALGRGEQIKTRSFHGDPGASAGTRIRIIGAYRVRPAGSIRNPDTWRGAFPRPFLMDRPHGSACSDTPHGNTRPGAQQSSGDAFQRLR